MVQLSLQKKQLPMLNPDPPEVVELFDVIETLGFNAIPFNETIVRSV